jgi:hypothetical protein
MPPPRAPFIPPIVTGVDQVLPPSVVKLEKGDWYFELVLVPTAMQYEEIGHDIDCKELSGLLTVTAADQVLPPSEV